MGKERVLTGMQCTGTRGTKCPTSRTLLSHCPTLFCCLLPYCTLLIAKYHQMLGNIFLFLLFPATLRTSPSLFPPPAHFLSLFPPGFPPVYPGDLHYKHQARKNNCLLAEKPCFVKFFAFTHTWSHIMAKTNKPKRQPSIIRMTVWILKNKTGECDINYDSSATCSNRSQMLRTQRNSSKILSQCEDFDYY